MVDSQGTILLVGLCLTYGYRPGYQILTFKNCFQFPAKVRITPFLGTPRRISLGLTQNPIGRLYVSYGLGTPQDHPERKGKLTKGRQGMAQAAFTKHSLLYLSIFVFGVHIVGAAKQFKIPWYFHTCI